MVIMEPGWKESADSFSATKLYMLRTLQTAGGPVGVWTRRRRSSFLTSLIFSFSLFLLSSLDSYSTCSAQSSSTLGSGERVRFMIGALSRESLWGEAGSREREFGDLGGISFLRLSGRGLGASGAGELRSWWGWGLRLEDSSCDCRLKSSWILQGRLRGEEVEVEEGRGHLLGGSGGRAGCCLVVAGEEGLGLLEGVMEGWGLLEGVEASFKALAFPRYIWAIG